MIIQIKSKEKLFELFENGEYCRTRTNNYKHIYNDMYFNRQMFSFCGKKLEAHKFLKNENKKGYYCKAKGWNWNKDWIKILDCIPEEMFEL